MMYSDQDSTGFPQSDVRLPFSYIDILIFLIPATTFIEFGFVGRLFLPDLLLLAFLPVLVVRRGVLLWQPLPRTFLALGVVWLFSQILTDLIVGSPLDDLARGWAKITLTLTSFMAIYLLIDGRYRRILVYALGIAVGALLTYFFNPSDYADGHPWKFGVGVSVTLFIVLAASVTADRRVAITLVMVASLLNVFQGFRSLGAICLMTGILLLLIARLKGHTVRIPTMIFLGAALATTGWGMLSLYEAAAGSGALGSAAYEKYQMQSSGSLGLLLGGRNESLGAFAAIKDSPFIGHGSWAKDCRYYLIWAFAMFEHGYQPPIDIMRPDPEQWGDCLIPSHSHLLAAWVEAGIGGTLFWLWVLLLIAKTSVCYLRESQKPSAFELFIAILLTWDVLFSPFGAARRFITPFYVIVMMYSYQKSQQENKAYPRIG